MFSCQYHWTYMYLPENMHGVEMTPMHIFRLVGPVVLAWKPINRVVKKQKTTTKKLICIIVRRDSFLVGVLEETV